jgi:hypothetical protein
MAQEDGLWLAINGGVLAEKIHYAIETHGQFSYPIPQGDYQPRRAELVIISLRARMADYIGVSVRSNRGTTGQTNVMISNLVPVPRLSVEDIRSALPQKFSNRFRPPVEGIYRPTPKLWEALLGLLMQRTPENTQRLDALQRTLREANRTGGRKRDGGLETLERDAIASALQAWGGPTARRRILRNAAPTEDEKAPFLARLKDVAAREDPQINHDHTVFPGIRSPAVKVSQIEVTH